MPKGNPPRSAILPPSCWGRRGGGLQSAERRMRPFDPGCRSAREGVALPWAGLICPSGAHRVLHIYSWNHSLHHLPGFRPGLSSGGPTGRAGGGHPPGIIINNPTIQQLNMPPGTSTPRIRPPSTLLFGGLVVCVLIHPLAHMAISHMG